MHFSCNLVTFIMRRMQLVQHHIHFEAGPLNGSTFLSHTIFRLFTVHIWLCPKSHKIFFLFNSVHTTDSGPGRNVLKRMDTIVHIYICGYLNIISQSGGGVNWWLNLAENEQLICCVGVSLYTWVSTDWNLSFTACGIQTGDKRYKVTHYTYYTLCMRLNVYDHFI